MFWGIELEPSKPQTLTPKYPLHITKCILGSSSSAAEEEKARTIVKCQSGEETKSSFVIASLRVGVKEQTSLDLVFEPEVPIVLSTSGPSKVNLVGFYITTFDNDEEEDFDDEEDFDEEDEEEEGDEEEEDDDDEDNLEALLGDKELEDDEEDFDPNENEKANKEQRMRDIIDDKIFKSELKAEKRQLKEEEEEEEKAPAKPSKKVQKVEKVEKPQKTAKEPEKKKQQQQQQQQKKTTGYEPQKFSNGLIVQDIAVGKGAKPIRGHKIVMTYVGRLKNGKVFDSCTRANPFSFKFGVGQVIKGWDIGINGMQVGGKRKLTIPPSLGYGSQRVGPIPANSTLIFDVELIAVK